jgi:hypothetical protein
MFLPFQTQEPSGPLQNQDARLKNGQRSTPSRKSTPDSLADRAWKSEFRALAAGAIYRLVCTCPDSVDTRVKQPLIDSDVTQIGIWTQIAQRGMAPTRVIEQFNVLEDFAAGLGPSAPPSLICQLF